MSELCNYEKIIVSLVKRKLAGYGNSSKELIKKENELFHLLCFLKENKKINKIEKIFPNEPGDFILKKKNKIIIIEVVECFGNKQTHIEVRNKLNKIFKRNQRKKVKGNYEFTIEESLEEFNNIIFNKNTDKFYLENNRYDEKVLLIVTGEYENCSSTGTWLEKILKEENFEINKYNFIWTIDYFASGRDGGPIIMENTIEEIIKYQNYINLK